MENEEDHTGSSSTIITTSAEVTKPMSKTQLKKIKMREYKKQKKYKKARTIILQQEGGKKEEDVFSSIPTPYVFLPNCGPFSGLSTADIGKYFRALAGDEYLGSITKPNTPYIQLVFANAKMAEQVVTKVNYSRVEEWGGRLMLLMFAKERWSGEDSESDIWTFQNVSGLQLVEKFISEKEQYEIVDILKSVPKEEWVILNLRRVHHWGYGFDYKKNRIDKKSCSPLPSWALKVVDKLKTISPHIPDQLTVNWYEPGAGIPSHVETHSSFEDGIISISLLNPVIMDLRHPEGQHVPLLLKPLSLLLLTGESRYLWSHGISARKNDVICEKLIPRTERISLTFRKVRTTDNPCTCQYRAQCDSWTLSRGSIPVKHNTPIENSNVKDVYNKIAPHFSDTRYKQWPKIQNFLQTLEIGSLVCDVGCGNGKYLSSNPDVFMLGNDQSENLCKIAKEKDNHEVLCCSNLQLPFTSNSFDVVISIAVIHHFSSVEHRLLALKELCRILRPGGKLLVYVWSMEQKEGGRRKFGQQDVLVSWNLDEKYFAEEGGEEENEDAGIPIKDSENACIIDEGIHLGNDTPKDVVIHKRRYKLFHRYYHVFKKGELTNLVLNVGGMSIIEEDFDHQNWTILAQKDVE